MSQSIMNVAACVALAAFGCATVRAQGLWVARTADQKLSLTDLNGRPMGSAPDSGNFGGAASDGTRLWTSMGKMLEERRLDGKIVRSFPMREELRDLAWDSRRTKLWGLFPDSQNLIQIEPSNGRIEMEVGFSSVDPLGSLAYIRAVGLAYDSKRDRVYISFCETANLSKTKRQLTYSCMRNPMVKEWGLVLFYNPEARSCEPLQIAFRTPELSLGLAYDSDTDTILMVTSGKGYVIRRYTVGGSPQGKDIAPYPTGYSLGLEYIARPVTKVGGE